MASHTVDALLAELRGHVSESLPAGWGSATLTWNVAGEREFGPTLMNVEPLPVTRGVIELMRELRAAVTTPDRGAPLSLELYFSAESTGVGLDLNFDERLVYDHDGREAYGRSLSASDILPTPGDWARELELHPRSNAHIPSWWRALLDGADAGIRAERPEWYGAPMPDSVEDAAAQPESLPPMRSWIVELAGFAAIVEPLALALVAAARQLTPGEQRALFGHDGLAAQRATRIRLAETAASGLRGTVGGLRVHDAMELVDTWHSLEKRDDIGVTPDCDPNWELGRAIQRPGGSELLAQVESVIRSLAEVIAVRRFGTLPTNWQVP